MLLWALNPETPYGYYLLLRIVICGICAFLAYRALKIGNDKWAWILGVTAVIYNPIFPIHLTREIWSVVNIATVVVLAATVGALRKRSLPEQPLIRCPVGFSGAYTIPDGVTSIGERAFSGCTSLTSVTIPESVISIGDAAFNECSALTSVTIPESVTSIGEVAFHGCTAVTSITIPASVTRIGMFAFADCTALTSVTFIGGYFFDTIGNSVFSGCTSLTSVTIPDGVTVICNQAFYGCSVLASVTIPDSVTNIGKQTFYGCTALTAVTIPDSVTSIGDRAFYGCKSLASVSIPKSVSSIGEHTFSLCSALTSITIPDSVTSIGNGAFSGCSALTSLTIPKNVTSIAPHAFHGCSALTSVTIPNSVISIGEAAFSGCTSLTSVTIPDSVTNICNQAFYGCSVLASVLFTGDAPTLSKCSKVINDSPFVFPVVFGGTAFRATIYYLPGTSGWGSTYDNLPAKPLLTYAQENGGIKITHIDTSFIGESLTIPDSLAGYPVTSIDDYAFIGCGGLTSVTIPNSVTSIGEAAFSSCTSLASVTIPACVTSIGSRVFGRCTALATVSIPDSVTSIGEAAFFFCSALTTVTIPASVTNISSQVFFRCTALATVTIPDSVTSIDDRAFAGCTALTSITIPDSVTSIGEFAFYKCTALTSVTIPASVRSIGKHAFSGCTSLASVLFIGDAPTFSNNADGICVTFPKAYFTRAKIYCRPGTSGWGATPIEKMIFRSEDEFAAYVGTHPEETAQWTEENFEIVPGEAAPATEAAPEPVAKQDAALTEEKFTPPKKRLGEPNVRYKERVAAAEEGWKTSRAAMEPDTMPGATTAERVAAALEATPESAERAREEASGNAEASSEEVNAARVEETNIDTGEVRYRLSRDIELGLVNPQTDIPVSAAEMKIVAETWEREFGGKAHNSTHLADFILCFPPEVAAARIKTADTIVEHLKTNPDNRFNTAFYDGSMGPAIREAFQARWFKDH